MSLGGDQSMIRSRRPGGHIVWRRHHMVGLGRPRSAQSASPGPGCGRGGVGRL